MIAKQVPMLAEDKSNFAGLVKYITDEQQKHERVGFINAVNCQSDHHVAATLEVLNTQAQNTRATSDKTYHLIVSFRPGEQVDDTILKAIEARICEGLGFGEHQRVSAVHHDTDNLHLHIAVNKIHPTRYTILDPFNDHKTLGQLCDMLEREFGLEVDNHQAHKTGSENRAGDMERHAGVESLLGWIKRECAEQMRGAQTWRELHEVMRVNGLVLQERGNGLVITDGTGLGVKASSVARELSKAKLEQRFGGFEPPPGNQPSITVQASRKARSAPVARVGQKPPPQSQNRLRSLAQLDNIQIDSGRRYEQKPMRSRVNTVELHARYKAERQTGSAFRTIEWARALAERNRLVEAAKRIGRTKRAAIKLVKGAGPAKRLMYAATSKTLRADIQAANKRYLQRRQAIYDKYQRRTWADWLRQQATEGDQEALSALRGREAALGLKGNTIAGQTPVDAVAGPFEHDSITKKGTIIYRVGESAVRDDGDKLNVSRGASREGLQAALRLAKVRYGERITVNGTDEFKEQIAQVAAAARLAVVFANPVLEQRRQALLRNSTQPPEKSNDTHTNRPTDRGRTDRGSFEGGRYAPTRNNVNAGASARRPGGGRSGVRAPTGLTGKPNVGGVGRKPPPQSQNRLRGLSELGVVHVASGGEVLLPRDVPGDVEQQRTQPIDGLRRNIFGPGLTSVGQLAADQYIAERERTRLKVFGIPKHSRYTYDHDGVAEFGGTRTIDGQALALLKKGDGVMVLPIDEATARRLKRMAIGESLTVTPQGAIGPKGRSR